VTVSSGSAAAQLLSRVSEEIKQRPWRPLPDKRLQVSDSNGQPHRFYQFSGQWVKATDGKTTFDRSMSNELS
jgi:hypothetical protein